MNTIHIAKALNKRHDKIIELLKRKLNVSELDCVMVKGSGYKKITSYNLSEEQIEVIPNGSLLIEIERAHIIISEKESLLEKALKEIENFKKDKENSSKVQKGYKKKISELEKKERSKNITIDALKDSLMLKKNSNVKYHEENAQLSKQVKKLTEDNEKQQSNIKRLMREGMQSFGYSSTKGLPEMTQKDYQTARQAFHPDKTNRDTKKIFIFFDNKLKESRV